jgi:hypothetical protein
MMWMAPVTPAREITLPVGLRFVVGTVSFLPTETHFSASAEPYEQWESVLVDPESLKAIEYRGYWLIIPFEAAQKFCRRLP